MPPKRGYPELTKTILSETTAPAPSSEPPFARTPLTVVCGRAVSNSHTTLPSVAANARRWPSMDPENTIPGIAVTAPGCAGLQPGRGGSHARPGAYQTFEPS